jgi:hypothetical protein
MYRFGRFYHLYIAGTFCSCTVKWDLITEELRVDDAHLCYILNLDVFKNIKPLMELSLSVSLPLPPLSPAVLFPTSRKFRHIS